MCRVKVPLVMHLCIVCVCVFYNGGEFIDKESERTGKERERKRHSHASAFWLQLIKNH